jgi:hypothetical protein
MTYQRAGAEWGGESESNINLRTARNIFKLFTDKFSWKWAVPVLAILILAVLFNLLYQSWLDYDTPKITNIKDQNNSEIEKNMIQKKDKITPNLPDDSQLAINLKGGKSKLFLFKKQNGKMLTLKNGDIVKQDDSLQIAYYSPGKPYGIIFSIDGKGQVTLHYPEDASKPVSLKGKEKIFLNFAYKLDDAPDFEKFYFITSTKPFKIGSVITSANKLAKKLIKNKKATQVFFKNNEIFSIFLKKK